MLQSERVVLAAAGRDEEHQLVGQRVLVDEVEEVLERSFDALCDVVTLHDSAEPRAQTVHVNLGSLDGQDPFQRAEHRVDEPHRLGLLARAAVDDDDPQRRAARTGCEGADGGVSGGGGHAVFLSRAAISRRTMPLAK